MYLVSWNDRVKGAARESEEKLSWNLAQDTYPKLSKPIKVKYIISAFLSHFLEIKYSKSLNQFQ